MCIKNLVKHFSLDPRKTIFEKTSFIQISGDARNINPQLQDHKNLEQPKAHSLLISMLPTINLARKETSLSVAKTSFTLQYILQSK